MTFANKITLFRIISIPFFIAALVFYEPDRAYLKWVALAIFLCAIISDVVDGYIARAKREKTRAGAILDPLADKALLISAFIFLYSISKIYFSVKLPLWVLIVVVSRDAIILVGSALIMMTHRNLRIEPTWWGKATTFFQMTTVAAIICEWRGAPIAWIIACAFTVISGVDYVRRGINTLNLEQPKTC
jgi:CDP-diacylglycerol--glycerol-3-phosphate 3-phosphatidyltransferase